jgi:sugar/nucleoside kinase (ribokinase family)
VTAVASLGRVAVIGPHILDVLGWPVETIPPGQGSVRLTEIRATAAGTAAGTAVDLAKLGASVMTFGAVGTDLLGDIVLAAMTSHGVDTSAVVRPSSCWRSPARSTRPTRWWVTAPESRQSGTSLLCCGGYGVAKPG